MLTLPPDAFLVFGHRGASAHARENSVAAFRLTATQGGDGVELDVRRTADGVLVVEVGHDRPALEEAYPALPFVWLETRAGDDFVFLLTAGDLRDASG